MTWLVWALVILAFFELYKCVFAERHFLLGVGRAPVPGKMDNIQDDDEIQMEYEEIVGLGWYTFRVFASFFFHLGYFVLFIWLAASKQLAIINWLAISILVLSIIHASINKAKWYNPTIIRLDAFLSVGILIVMIKVLTGQW